ncbi:hypothetical protein MWJ18_000046 [Campylobacter lari]|uniref:hypothetical protein n=1 Tax=Campylobacter lari TaxID=201 RepID=UPI00107903F2|nr:hypothetical protein [Campylobacter lari]EAC1839747.1 hypothetical protein [Campylobacter lari]EAH7781171.1 hypothetical protein [Campylobacter lari]EAH8420585.1 hypothetical protein [Campylobacter lari]EAI0903325.1 hypothetical protein [Campylobacter lari]EAI2358009.1 hypothetical protein [Campylobacter lari]
MDNILSASKLRNKREYIAINNDKEDFEKEKQQLLKDKEEFEKEKKAFSKDKEDFEKECDNKKNKNNKER